MTQPAYLFNWAVNNTVDPISGTANKIQPQSTLQANGFFSTMEPSAQNINWLLNNIGQWIAYLFANSTPAPSGFVTTVITSDTIAVASTMYLVEEGGSLITVTLPATSALGDEIVISSFTVPLTVPAVVGFQINAAPTQFIQVLAAGAKTSLLFDQSGASVYLKCAIPNQLWLVMFQQGNVGA